MTDSPTTLPAPYGRAAALGVGLTLAGTVAAVVLLRWSLVGLAQIQRSGTVPVETGLVLLLGLLAGLICSLLAFLAALGVGALPKTRLNPSRRRSSGLSQRWGVRAAALLVALSMGTPLAQASQTPAPVLTLSATANAAPGADSATPGEAGNQPPPSDEATPLPGWSPTSATAPSATAPSATTPNAATPSAAASTTASPAGAAPSRDIASPEDGMGIVVIRGDTLWSIASASLGPGATDAQIAEHWPAWYEANRRTIGPDPNLILPGHILHPPSHLGAQP